MNKDGSLTDIEQNWLREYRSWCKSDAPLQLKIEIAREFRLTKKRCAARKDNQMSNRMQYGFVDLYGGQWKDCFVDDYNRMSEEIDAKERGGMNVEWLKDARHRFFVCVAEMYLEERRTKSWPQ